MLRVLQAGTGRPISYPVDPNASFQPGMIAQSKKIGNDMVVGVSDGLAPFAIIDELKDTAFVRPVIDEVVIVEAPVINTDGYQNYMGFATDGKLTRSNIMQTSFVSNIPGLQLNSVNGTVTVPVGATLNYRTPDFTGTGNNALRAIVSYSYSVANRPGEDTTFGSGRITLWFTRGIFQTDQYELMPYITNANLYVSAAGKLTPEKSYANQPVVGMVLVPPSASNAWLEFLWY